MIKLSIDVSKITKEKLFKGEKGIYLDAVLIETPNSEHNDYMIVESVTKEEREAGNKGVILGNGRIVVKTNQELSEEDVKDLPF
jgi:hypothetical protein